MRRNTETTGHKDIMLVPILGLFMTIIPLLLLGMAFVEPEALDLTIPTGGEQVMVGNIPETGTRRLEIVTRLENRSHRIVTVYPDTGDSLRYQYNGKDLFLLLDNVIADADSVETIAGIDMDDRLPYRDLVAILDALRNHGIVKTMIYPPTEGMGEAQ